MSVGLNKTTKTILLKAVKIPASSGIVTSDMLIQDGKISEIAAVHAEKSPDSTKIINAAGAFLLPGFVDVHTNGAAGFDATWGLYDPAEDTFDSSKKAYLNGLEQAAGFFLSHGTTRVVLSMIAAPLTQLKQALHNFAEFKATHPLGKIYEGIFIEGSFIASGECAGAHNPAYFLKPSFDLIRELQDCADGHIRIVNLPPEHGLKIRNLIPALNEMGIIVAGGHSGATFEQFKSAAEMGFRAAVHFLNGHSRNSFKPFYGGSALEAALSLDSVFTELISDFYHVSRGYLLDVLQRKTPERFLAITDSMFVTGLSNVRRFRISGLQGEFSKNQAYLQIRNDPGTLFGSLLTMSRSFENLLSLQTAAHPGIWTRLHPALPFERALYRTLQMCAFTPMNYLNFKEDQPIFDLQPGMEADLILGQITGSPGDYHLQIKKVFLAGEQKVQKMN